MLDKVPKEDIKKFQSLKGVIEDLQKTMEQYSDYLSENETRTRQFLIDPLLRELDWDVLNPNDVQLEYGIKSGSGTKRLDYVLTRDDWAAAVVEAKRLNCKPNWAKEAKKTKKILDNDPIKEDIHYIIVTDGNRWLIYEASEVCLNMSFELYDESSDAISLQVLPIWKWRWKSEFAFPDDKIKDDSAVLSSIEQLYLDYWTALKNSFEGRNGIKFTKPLPQCFMTFAVGRSDFHIHTWASKNKRYVNVGLTVQGIQGKSHFDRLKMSKTEIESEIGAELGAELEWQENPKQNYIRLYLRNIDLTNQRDWGRQHQWLCEQLETFYRVFSERIRAL